MDIKKTLMWVVFSVSGVMLFNNWQISQGHQPLPFLAPPQSVEQAAKHVEANKDIPRSAITQNTQAPASHQDNAGEEKQQTFTLKNDVLELSISNKGANIVYATLLKHFEDNQPIVLFNNQASSLYVARSGLIAAEQDLPNHNDFFTARVIEEGKSILFTLKKNGVFIEKTLTLKPNSYLVVVQNKISNLTNAPINPQLYNELVRDGTTKSESQFYSTFTGPAYYTTQNKYSEVSFSDIEKRKAPTPASVVIGESAWVAMAQHYFASAWIPEDTQTRDFYFDKLENNLYRVGIKSTLPEIAPGKSVIQNSNLFIGPEEESLLVNVAPGFEHIKDYGRLTIIAKPIFWLLTQIHHLVQNWGWAIIVLTICIKLLFFPLSAASYKSMARMKDVQPKMVQMKEQYKNDPQKLNAAMMEMYKKEKINPLGGCLPVVIQIPVFISLYWVLLLSVEMRGAPWLGWIHDLSKPDTLISQFIGISTPIGILPIIMAVSMFIQTKLNPTPPDPIQAKVMLFMPLAFSLMFFFFPSGLVLYYIVNNVLSIAQQWQINRMYGVKK